MAVLRLLYLVGYEVSIHFLSPMYSDARFAMSGPSPGVSLSQPGVMLSHRPGYGGMLDMDRHGPHPYMGGASGDKGLLAHGGVGSKLTDSRRVDRASSIDEELDWDVEEEEGHSKVGVAN